MPRRISAKNKKALAKRRPKERAVAVEKFLNVGETLPEVRKEVLDEKAPVRTCYVCERTGRDLQMITADKHRCIDCEPGSPNWLDYWERLHEDDPRKKNGKFLYDQSKRGKKCEKQPS